MFWCSRLAAAGYLFIFSFLAFGGALEKGGWKYRLVGLRGLGSTLHPAATAAGVEHQHQMGAQSKKGSHSGSCWRSVSSVPSHDT